jgi:hypothetical protein
MQTHLGMEFSHSPALPDPLGPGLPGHGSPVDRSPPRSPGRFRLPGESDTLGTVPILLESDVLFQPLTRFQRFVRMNSN